MTASGVLVTDVDHAPRDFRVGGEVENPRRLAWDELEELPTVEITGVIHSVTRGSRFYTTLRGVPWSTLGELVHPTPSARFALAHQQLGRLRQRVGGEGGLQLGEQPRAGGGDGAGRDGGDGGRHAIPGGRR